MILPTTALVAEAGPAAVAVVGAAVAVAQPGPQLPHHHQQLAGGWRTGAMAALAIWLSTRGRPAARWVLQRRHLESSSFRNNAWKPFQRQNIFFFCSQPDLVNFMEF